VLFVNSLKVFCVLGWFEFCTEKTTPNNNNNKYNNTYVINFFLLINKDYE